MRSNVNVCALADHKWEHGVSFDYMEELLAHWRDAYDWREHEARLNENMPQFKTNIDGIELHFAHKKVCLSGLVRNRLARDKGG